MTEMRRRTGLRKRTSQVNRKGPKNPGLDLFSLVRLKPVGKIGQDVGRVAARLPAKLRIDRTISNFLTATFWAWGPCYARAGHHFPARRRGKAAKFAATLASHCPGADRDRDQVRLSADHLVVEAETSGACCRGRFSGATLRDGRCHWRFLGIFAARVSALAAPTRA